MIIKKFRLFVFYTNEEQWINDMAQEGLHFVKYSFGLYHFEEGQPGKYEYRLELLDAYPTSVLGKQYIDSMEEIGIECIETSSKWAYFRKKATSEPFDIFTDVQAKKRHLNRIIYTLIFGWLANIFLAYANTFSENGFYFTRYFTNINLIVTLVLIPIILKYVKMKRNLNPDD